MIPQLILAVLLASYLVNSVIRFRKHLLIARRSGIKVVATPFAYNGLSWILAQPILVPLLRCFPAPWLGPWLDVTVKVWSYPNGHEKFQPVGSDTFLATSPKGTLLYTADPDVITQITSRPLDFIKPDGSFQRKMTAALGSNIVFLEGAAWRRHRHIVAPSFSDRNHKLVWLESLRQATFATQSWLDKPRLTSTAKDIMRISLHVITKAGFGIDSTWPGQPSTIPAPDKDPYDLHLDTLQDGHRMSFVEAVNTLTDRLFTVLLFPSWARNLLPFPSIRSASLAYSEWQSYNEQLYNLKSRQVASSNDSPSSTHRDGADLLGAMIRSNASSPEKPLSATSESAGLSKEEILGNAFAFFLAGHDTSAHTLQMCLLHLALYPSAQRSLQADIDLVLGNKPMEEWSYEHDFKELEGGWCGAVMNEALRLVPAILNITKATSKEQDQRIIVEGSECTVPRGTNIYLVSGAVHRDEKYWRGGELDEFKPERWVMDEHEGQEKTEKDDRAGEVKRRKLWKPVKGAFIPFSDGKRGCIGRHFATVEIVAVLAYVFKHYSVELVVDDGMEARLPASKEEWDATKAKAMKTIREKCKPVVAMRLKGDVPIRLVRRGEEKFFDC